MVRSTSLNRRGPTWWPWPGAPKVAGTEEIRDCAAWAHESWGQVLGTGTRSWDGTVGGSGRGSRRARSERVDELERVVGELARPVGAGQALDQPQPAVAMLELEELLAVDNRPHVERAKGHASVQSDLRRGARAVSLGRSRA